MPSSSTPASGAISVASPTSTSSVLTSRSTHDTRFVHNIRLWGKDGQEALENTHILALGCSSLACQTIKNLVLPGAGNFTIVDDQTIALENAQTNFFLSSESNGNAASQHMLGKPLAEAATACLVDLHRPNPETGGVTGKFILKNPNAFVEKGPSFSDFLKENTINVILISASVVKESTIGMIAKLIESPENEAIFGRVFVLVLHLSGYVGAIRMASVNDATIVKSVQSKDETFDTRYSDPFPKLRQWMDAHSPLSVPAAEVTRVPYFVLAYHALKAYTNQLANATCNGGGSSGSSDNPSSLLSSSLTAASALALTVPDTSDEWKRAQQCLCDLQSKCVTELAVEGSPATEKVPTLDSQDEVVEEAMMLLTRAKGDLKARSISELQRVWKRADEIIAAKGSSTDLYWFVAKAIQAFKANNNNNLPLSMEIPDFHTNTEWYRELVGLYREESQREIAEVAERTRALLQEHNKTDVDEPTLIEKCKLMVPHARYLACTRYVPLSCEYDTTPTNPLSDSEGGASSGTHGVKLSYCPEDGLHDPCGFYIALKIAHKFASDTGRYPGAINDNAAYEADQRAVAAKYASSSPSPNGDVVDTDCNWVTSPENIMCQIEEVVRGGGGELITTAAIVGALAAQEVIKYVQQRYIPAGSLVVFDGHASLTHCVEVSAINA